MGVINPIKLLFISIFIWIFIYIQIPVTYLYEGSIFFPIFSLILFIGSLILGILSLKGSSVKSIKIYSTKKINQIVFVFFIIGVIGILLKIYIGFFKTEIFVTDDIFEKRMDTMGKELTGGAIGIVASILFPFAYINLLIAIYNYKQINKWFLTLIILLGFYPLIETYFMGGRTVIALLGATIIFVLFASFFKNSTVKLIKITLLKKTLLNVPKFLFNKKIIIPTLLIIVLFVSYSVSVVNKRLTRFGYGDSTLRVWEQKDYQWVKFNDNFKTAYFKASQEEKNKMIGYYSLKHYFAHGVIEYIRLVNHLEYKTGYYYGQYEFNVFFKFFKAFGVPLKSMGELNSITKRKAVYKTFWGEFYIDFGLFGIIIMFFWGRFVKRIYTYSKRGSTPHLIFYGYLSTLLITSFFINFLLGSSSYYLFAFLISLLIFKYWPNNLVLKLKKMNKVLIFLIALIFLSCNQEKKKGKKAKSIINYSLDESSFVVDTTYKKGDVRRYGVYPNEPINTIKLAKVIQLANNGLPIVFPKGYYKANLFLEGITNAKFTFDDVIIAGKINIIEKDTIASTKISLIGTLTVLDKIFIRKSSYIKFNTLNIVSDTILNINHKKNRGVSIYAGSKHISFNLLKINDTGGSSSNYYKHTNAALQIHGWNNNPENINIKKLIINDVARNALYITGNNNKINHLSISNYGKGSIENLFDLEDAAPNEAKKFTGFWMNRCNNCEIDTLIIDNNTNKGVYSMRLDEGVYSKPSFIYNISIRNEAKKLPIKDEELTNILVKNEF